MVITRNRYLKVEWFWQISQTYVIVENKKGYSFLTIGQKRNKKKAEINQNLSVEIQRMQNLESFFIPAMTGAKAVIAKLLKKYLEITAGKAVRTVVLGTARDEEKCYNAKLEA